ncbi:MAG: hypothetical protein GY926_18600 [bacterium]|nr:hypothetical protein [bacterium]
MNRYLIDTRTDHAILAYADGSECKDWEINGEPDEPEYLTLTAHGVELFRVTIEVDGSILVDVHPETPMVPVVDSEPSKEKP